MDAATNLMNKPGNMSAEDYWLHVYVMLSRVRTTEQMLIHGLPEKEILEMGPPPLCP
jgi:hypothetical protein